MAEKDLQTTRQFLFEWRFVYLFMLILVLIAIKPFQEAFKQLDILLDIILTIVLFAAVNAVSQKKSQMVTGIVLAVPMFTTTWATSFIDIAWLNLTAAICGAAFFIFLAFAIFQFILNQDEVTRDLISGAASVYLLQAVIWAFVYAAVEIVQPGSFHVSEQHITETHMPFMYYSIVTLTTLGYGDIFPVTTTARSFATLEALIGQIYLVFTVARLVGIHTTQSMERKKKRQSGRSRNR
jgi:hypothetical protein